VIEVKSAVDLSSKTPRILVNMHFTSIESSIILSALLSKEKHWPRTSGLFQRIKNPFFNKKLLSGAIALAEILLIDRAIQRRLFVKWVMVISSSSPLTLIWDSKSLSLFLF